MATANTTSFELQGADGGPLRGEVRTAAKGIDRPAVIICHGFKGFKDWGFFPHLAARLARAGMTVVTFNFSGSGVGPDGESFSEPERFGHATVSNDLADVATVVGTLLAGDLVPGLVVPAKLGFFGHSRGGAVALLHSANAGGGHALVTWSAVADLMRWDQRTRDRWRAKGKIEIVNARTGDVLPLYTDYLDDLERNRDGRFNLLDAATSVGIPWLIVHGEADEAVAVGDGERLHRAARQATTRFERIPGGSHTLGARHPWAGSTLELDRGMSLTVEWFSRALL
jgi:dienelactone hydrolase